MSKNEKQDVKKPLYLIFGEEYAVDQAARETVDRLCPKEAQTFGLEMVDGAAASKDEAVAALQASFSALRTVGFLGEGKVVWLKNASFFAMDKLGRSEEVVLAVQRVCDYVRAGLPDGVHWVVSAGKVYKSSAFYKAAKALGEVIEFQVEEQAYKQDKRAIELAEEFFRAAGLVISRENLVFFAERTGMNSRQMAQDVEKISIYLGVEKTVTEDVIDLLVPPTKEALVWHLPEAVASRDVMKMLQSLRPLFEQKESALGMMIVVERHFSKLAVLRACLDRGWASVAGEGFRESVVWNLPPDGENLLSGLGSDDPRGGNPYVTLLAIRQAKAFTGAELAWCKERLMQAHYQMMNSPVPPEIQLELALLEITGRKTARPAAARR